MKNVLRELAARQDGVVACWQLEEADMSWKAIRHQTAHLRRLHDGVYLTGEAEPTRRQRWRAATITSPASVLSHASAGAAHGFRPWQGAYEVVTRKGSGGPKVLSRPSAASSDLSMVAHTFPIRPARAEGSCRGTAQSSRAR